MNLVPRLNVPPLYQFSYGTAIRLEIPCGGKLITGIKRRKYHGEIVVCVITGYIVIKSILFVGNYIYINDQTLSKELMYSAISCYPP